MAEERKSFKVENAELIYRNFAGKVGPYNDRGERSFCVILDPETAEVMAADGWNVRYQEPREEGDLPRPYINVAARFDIRPPRIIMISGTSRVNLDESSVEILDWADIRNADLIATAFYWEVGGKSGLKAYLKTLFVTIEEDELERKYAANEVSE